VCANSGIPGTIASLALRDREVNSGIPGTIASLALRDREVKIRGKYTTK
jgi:hypothetical protein